MGVEPSFKKIFKHIFDRNNRTNMDKIPEEIKLLDVISEKEANDCK